MDGDLHGGAAKIDTKVCPLYQLTGEYDFSRMPENAKRTAASIDAALVTIMEKVDHFPMSENPKQFRRHIAPVPGEIVETSSLSSKQGVHV